MVNLVEVSNTIEKEVLGLIKCLSKYKSDQDAMLVKNILKTVMKLSNDLKKLRRAMKNNQLLIVYGLLPKILDKVIYLRKQTDDATILNRKVKKCLKQTSKRRISRLKTFKSEINSDHALLKTSMKHGDNTFKYKKTIKRVKKLKGTRRKNPKHV